MCLSKIGTQPLRAGESGLDQASTVALDALHLLCRDDSSEFRIMTRQNVKFLASQLQLAEQSSSTDSSIKEVQR